MNRRKFLVATPLALAGCASWLKPDPETGETPIDPAITKYLVETAGMAMGAVVAQMPPEIDAALRNVYNLAVDGTFDMVSINQLIGTLVVGDDLIAKLFINRLIGAVELLGGQVVQGKIASLENVDSELLTVLGGGYAQGYALTGRELRRRRSA